MHLEYRKNEHKNLGVAMINVKLQNHDLVALYQEKDLGAWREVTDSDRVDDRTLPILVVICKWLQRLNNTVVQQHKTLTRCSAL